MAVEGKAVCQPGKQMGVKGDVGGISTGVNVNMPPPRRPGSLGQNCPPKGKGQMPKTPPNTVCLSPYCSSHHLFPFEAVPEKQEENGFRY